MKPGFGERPSLTMPLWFATGARVFSLRPLLCLVTHFFVLSLPAAESPAPTELLEMTSARTLGRAFAAASRKVRPAVVSIRTESPARSQEYVNPLELFNDEFARRFFHGRPQPQQQMVEGMGSGFLITADGQILTNTHVIKDALRITVRLPDGRELPAQVVGADEKSDVSLLKIDASGLPTLTFGDSSRVEVGEWVLAVGSPFGLTQTVTSGIVSATGRNSMGILDFEDFIQTDAAINPGNSGGPLINLEGEVVGLNTAIFSKSGGYMGIGLSIPANAVQHILRQLRSKGRFQPGYLGATVRNLTSAEKEKIGRNTGAVIEQIPPRSPAAIGGLRTDDLILSVNGRPVADAAAFISAAALIGAGETATLEIIRGGKIEEHKIWLSDQESAGADLAIEKLGLWIRALNAEEQARIGNPALYGSLVTRIAPGGIASALDIAPGCIILKVNGQDATTPDRLQAALASAYRQNTMELLVIQQGSLQRILVRLR